MGIKLDSAGTEQWSSTDFTPPTATLFSIHPMGETRGDVFSTNQGYRDAIILKYPGQ
jgi:hypothetical protein